jgi:hypothetical protein
MGNKGHVSARLHRLGVLGAAIVFAVTLVIAIGTGSAGAAAKIAVLGTAAPAAPSCPQDCQAIGKTTGVQLAIGKTKSPFVVPYPGKVVAWSIKLSSPTEKQIEFFDDFFGGPPQARISVLKPVMKQIKLGKPIYELKAQSPVEELSPFLGQTTTFQLAAPLKVKANHVIGLTVPTWAPAFAVNLGGGTSWMASRKQDHCAKAADIQAGSAQESLGSSRSYGCVYKTARLLYSATVVGRPGATTPPATPPKKKRT